MYKNGNGVEQNDKKAFELYQKSAAKGNITAFFNVRNSIFLFRSLQLLTPLVF